MLQSPATKSHTGAAPATQRHTATHMQRISCTSHPDPHSNATRMLQSTAPATKCHTGVHCATASHCNAPFPAPATQSHAPTLPGCFNHLPPNLTLVLRLPHNVTLQRTCNTSHPKPRSNATRMLQSTAPATKCHTGAAPATQCHNSTYHSLHQPHRSTLQLEVSRAQASQFHVYKRANFTCTSEPAPFPGHVPESNNLFLQMIRNLRAHLVLNFEAGSLLPYNEYLEEHGWSLCFNDVQDCLAHLRFQRKH